MRLMKIAAVVLATSGAMVLVMYAVPAAKAQLVRERAPQEWRRVIVGGPVLGVSVRDVDEADVGREKLQSRSGAVVTNVERDSPAADAGLRAGDIIVAFDGDNVRSARHLTRLVDETPDGREVSLTVLRQNQRVALKVTPEAHRGWTDLGALGELRDLPNRLDLRLREVLPDLERFAPLERLDRPDRLDRFDRFDRADVPGLLRLYPGRARLGVDVQELTDQLAAFFGVTDGVLITAVSEGTPARTAGLRAGDVITKVNSRTIRSGVDLRRELAAAASGEAQVTIVREKKEQTIGVKGLD
jgi:serine protease Do